jgi:two-component system, OmpR family, response regulator
MKTLKAPISVFLVDDDKMYLSSLKYDLLQKFKSSINVAQFTTGEACLKNMPSQPDIVVLDYYLHDDDHPEAMDGMEVLKKIKATWKQTTVIILSGQDKLQIALEAIKNGAYEYVAKSESAFVRMENVLNNIIEKIESTKESKTYEKWNFLVGAFFLALIIFDIIYYYTK